jgi:hypothetical protein
LRNNGILLEVDQNKLVVTPEGKLKIFWAHIRPKNSHLSYYRRLFFGY